MASVNKVVNRGRILRQMNPDEYRLHLKALIKRNSKASPSGCIEWQANKFSNGYGSTRLYGRVTSAHRAAYFSHHARLTKWLDICHACDNRLCVNIDHLYEATHLENMRDMIRKGRRRQGASNPRRGTLNKQSKPVYMAGFVFPSIGDAARAIGVTKRAVQFRIKAGTAITI